MTCDAKVFSALGLKLVQLLAESHALRFEPGRRPCCPATGGGPQFIEMSIR
jgi:hypothetical protein